MVRSMFVRRLRLCAVNIEDIMPTVYRVSLEMLYMRLITVKLLSLLRSNEFSFIYT